MNKGKTQGALKEQRLVTAENFDNEQSAKTQLGTYIQISFLAKNDISDVQKCSGFLAKKKMPCGCNYEFKTEKEEIIRQPTKLYLPEIRLNILFSGIIAERLNGSSLPFNFADFLQTRVALAQRE